MDDEAKSPPHEILPRKIEEITAEWATNALASGYPGTIVTSLYIGSVIAGTATKIRLLLSYNDAGHRHGLPPTMWLKGGFINHDYTYEKTFINEVLFYRDWGSQLSINMPKCFFAQHDGDGRGQGLVLLEDLLSRNVTFGYATRPITLDQQAQTLALLADVHARWWLSPVLNKVMSFTEHWGAADQIVMEMLTPSFFYRYLESPRGTFIAGDYRNTERVAAGLRAQWRRADEIQQCFTHGDPHLGNMYFERDGLPGFLDWQVWESGPYMHDVAYSIIGNLTVADRRRSERDLLAHYLTCLGNNGVQSIPTPDAAWEAYRRHAMHGFMWFLTPKEMQPDEVCEAEAERFGVAVVDLDTLGALGV